jgi:hypothetical protein
MNELVLCLLYVFLILIKQPVDSMDEFTFVAHDESLL